MKRLLCIVGSMNAGGAETFLMKIFREIDKSKYQMDFCVATSEKGFYDSEIERLGGKIYHIIPKSKGLIKNLKDIFSIVKKEQYKYVMRISQHSISSLELLAAKIGGAKIIAFRSSNTNSGGSKLNLLLHYLFRPVANRIVNVKIAPSTEAANYMFGKGVVKKNKYFLLNNGLDLEKFKYSQEVREKIRKKLGVEEKFVIGHVGRFSRQKNHKFLLEIFKEYLKRNDNSVLLLIGKGELENEIKEYSKTLQINDKVIFYGVSENVNKLYSAMDIFIFPSLFEGMPNTVIEAQASGLDCVISDTITKECNITGNVKFKSLQESPKQWSDEIIVNNRNRSEEEKIFEDKSYDIKSVTRKFEKIIFNEG